jgi:hypothetical protein
MPFSPFWSTEAVKLLSVLHKESAEQRADFAFGNSLRQRLIHVQFTGKPKTTTHCVLSFLTAGLQ